MGRRKKNNNDNSNSQNSQKSAVNNNNNNTNNNTNNISDEIKNLINNPKLNMLISDLPEDEQISFKRHLINKSLLNKQVPSQWVKKHPIYGCDYIPIDKVELLLDVLFKKYNVLVKDIKQVLNSIVVVIRVEVIDYNDTERVVEGVGACPIQVDKGANPVDINKIKFNGVQLATPIAKSLALKDACDHLGIIFGRNINRKDVIGFDVVAQSLYTTASSSQAQTQKTEQTQQPQEQQQEPQKTQEQEQNKLPTLPTRETNKSPLIDIGDEKYNIIITNLNNNANQIQINEDFINYIDANKEKFTERAYNSISSIIKNILQEKNKN